MQGDVQSIKKLSYEDIEIFFKKPYKYEVNAKNSYIEMKLKGIKDKDGYLEEDGFIKIEGENIYKYSAVYDNNIWYDKRTKQPLSGDDPPDAAFIIENCIAESSPEFVSEKGGLYKYNVNINVAFIDPINYSCPGYLIAGKDGSIERIFAQRENMKIEINLQRTKNDIKEIKNIKMKYGVKAGDKILKVIGKRVENSGSGYRNRNTFYLYYDNREQFVETAMTDSIRFSRFSYVEPHIESDNIRYIRGDIRNTVLVELPGIAIGKIDSVKIEENGPGYNMTIFMKNLNIAGEFCCYTNRWAFPCVLNAECVCIDNVTESQMIAIKDILEIPYSSGKVEIKEAE